MINSMLKFDRSSKKNWSHKYLNFNFTIFGVGTVLVGGITLIDVAVNNYTGKMFYIPLIVFIAGSLILLSQFIQRISNNKK